MGEKLGRGQSGQKGVWSGDALCECRDFCFCCLSWAFGSSLLASEPLVLKMPSLSGTMQLEQGELKRPVCFPTED